MAVGFGGPVPIPSQPESPMSTLDINARTIAKAVQDAKPGAQRYEISDSRARGLRLRVGPQGAIWQYRYERLAKGYRFDLGSVVDWTLVDARELAASAAAHRRLGGEIDNAWLQAEEIKRGKRAPAPLAPVQSWDWSTARDLYLEEVQRANKPKTHRDYKARLTNTPELKRFEGRQVATVTRKEATKAVEDIHSRGAESQAEHVAVNISAFFNWLAKDARSDETGVERGRMTSLEVPPRSMRAEVVKKKYAPPMHEVGRLMAIARSGAIDERIGLAIQHLVFSVQRITFVVHARVDAMEVTAAGDEGLWIMDPYHRKTAIKRGDTTDHIVPLPAPAWQVVQRAMDITEAENSARVFPGMRPRKTGDVVDALAESTVQHTMSYMPGIVATPHDLRRSFAKWGQSKFKWGLEGSKLILDHNEGVPTDDVTVRNYLHDGSDPKWDIMRNWCGWVEEVTAEAIEFDKRLTDPEWIADFIGKRRYEHKNKVRLGISLAKNKNTDTVEGRL